MVNVVERIGKWLLKRRLKRQLEAAGVPKPQAEVVVQKLIDWIVNLRAVPSGWLTKSAGWVGLLVALACYFHVTIPGVPCPADPQAAVSTALASLGIIGLGRRS